MIKSIIHAGGESTRLKESFSGPKALAPVNDHNLLWFHLQPLLKSKVISEYVFTLRHQHELVQNYIEKLKNKFNISTASIVEPKPLGRAGVIRFGIENGIIDIDDTYLMSYPDDLVPIDIKELNDYAFDAESKDKSLVIVMAKRTINQFGIGIGKEINGIIELKEFKEKPELPLIENHFANTGMTLFLPEAMKEFKNVPLDRLTNPEDEIIPRLVKRNKAAVFLVARWISVNHVSEYKNILKMGKEKLLEFLNV
jgi:NDP-sugar pyrophosphorylase family protein